MLEGIPKPDYEIHSLQNCIYPQFPRIEFLLIIQGIDGQQIGI
jgi:hypothetical protein